MTSAQNPHGGQEATILSIYTTKYHWGAIVAAPGYTDPVTFGAEGESLRNKCYRWVGWKND